MNLEFPQPGWHLTGLVCCFYPAVDLMPLKSHQQSYERDGTHSSCPLLPGADLSLVSWLAMAFQMSLLSSLALLLGAAAQEYSLVGHRFLNPVPVQLFSSSEQGSKTASWIPLKWIASDHKKQPKTLFRIYWITLGFYKKGLPNVAFCWRCNMVGDVASLQHMLLQCY